MTLVKAADQSVQIINKTAKADTMLARIQTAREACLQLLEYHEKGIATLGSSPDVWLSELNRVELAAVDAEIRDAKFTAQQKSSDASTPAAKLTPFARSIERLTKLLDFPTDVSAIEMAIDELRRDRDEIRIRSLMKKSEVWAAKDKPRKAIEVLREAQVELLHDITPNSEQVALARELEERIEEFENKTT